MNPAEGIAGRTATTWKERRAGSPPKKTFVEAFLESTPPPVKKAYAVGTGMERKRGVGRSAMSAPSGDELKVSSFSAPGMDCPTEAALVRSTLGGDPSITGVQIDIATRSVKIVHSGEVSIVQQKLARLGFGADLLSSSTDGPNIATPSDVLAERRVLWTVLLINTAMFAVEFAAGWLADSSGLLADSLDMLADALVYGISLGAVARSARQQQRSAALSSQDCCNRYSGWRWWASCCVG